MKDCMDRCLDHEQCNGVEYFFDLDPSVEYNCFEYVYIDIYDEGGEGDIEDHWPPSMEDAEGSAVAMRLNEGL